MQALKSWVRSRPRIARPLRPLVDAGHRLVRLAKGERGLDRSPSVREVLQSGQLNMLAGRNLAHERLEREFAAFVGCAHAVAVNTGGMGIQMTLRALGLRPGDEVVLPVDTCVANAFSVLNARATPVFADISASDFMMSHQSALACVGDRTRVLMPVHMWGNPQDVAALVASARERGLAVVEDGCLALGARLRGRHVGGDGTAAVFSFGVLKPVQAGEGGIVVTNDASLARELRTLRSYGDTAHEHGHRDQCTLAWNGRMAEIVAALALDALREYRSRMDAVSGAVEELKHALAMREGIEVVDAASRGGVSVYSQIVLRLNASRFGATKPQVVAALREAGYGVRDANFEPVTGLTFFRGDEWQAWVDGDRARAAKNYAGDFPVASQVFRDDGLGLPREAVTGKGAVATLLRALDRCRG